MLNLRRANIYLFVALLGLPPLAGAHLVGSTSGASGVWQVDPVAVLLLALTAALYWRGTNIQRRRSLADRAQFIRKQYFFWGGWFTLVVALATPIDTLGEQLFSVHMIQHELVMVVAGPLLVLARPTSALLLGLGLAIARPAVAGANKAGLLRSRKVVLSPGAAWTIHAVGLWGWHVPYLFNASLQNSWIHTAQHFSFLAIALIFWYSLLHIQKSRSAVGMLYLFTTAIHASLLGALLTFSPKVWYVPYLATAPAYGLTALEDQQLGGLIMWMPSGIVFIAAALMFLARLLPDNPTTAAEGNCDR